MKLSHMNIVPVLSTLLRMLLVVCVILYTWKVKNLLSKELNDNQGTVYNIAVNSLQRYFTLEHCGGSYKHTVYKEENYVQMDGSPYLAGSYIVIVALSQSQPPIISHQTVSSPDTSTLTFKNYYKYTLFPRTIIHWNALPAFIPLLPTLAQLSNAVYQVEVLHLFP